MPRRQPAELPEGFWYSVKCRALGLPLVTEQLKNQRRSRPLALGVLSCDGLSSAAYGTEEILRALLPFFGLAAFSLVLPMTLLILFGVVLVVLSYREVVSVYTRAGGSYVVARENFGPRVAQVAAVALLIDYVVTVAVQTAAGSAAIVSAFPALSGIPVIGPKILLVISVVAILAMCLGNLLAQEAAAVFGPTPAATIIPFDVRHKVETIHARRRRAAAHREQDPPAWHDSRMLACEVTDSTGELTAVFYGRAHIPAWNPAAGSGCAAWSASAPTAAPP